MRSQNKKAFTLVEIVVATAIASVIGYFVISFSLSVARVWKANQRLIGTQMNADLALDFIESDVSNAATMQGLTGVQFAVTVLDENDGSDSDRQWKSGSLRLSEDDFDPNQNKYGWAGTWVRFFTAAPSLNAVAYQIVRREPYTDSSLIRYGLFRSVVRQDYTEGAGFDLSANAYSDPSSSNPDSSNFGHAKTIARPSLDDLLVDNVVDFGVCLYVYDKDSGSDPISSAVSSPGLKLLFPVVANLDVDGQPVWNLNARTHMAGATAADGYPDVVEIFLRILDEEGARLLEAAEKGAGGATFEEIVAEHGQLYRRMVKVRSGGDAL